MRIDPEDYGISKPRRYKKKKDIARQRAGWLDLEAVLDEFD